MSGGHADDGAGAPGRMASQVAVVEAACEREEDTACMVQESQTEAAQIASKGKKPPIHSKRRATKSKPTLSLCGCVCVSVVIFWRLAQQR